MTDKVVVYVTCGSSREARKIGKTPLEKRLAAWVNLLGPTRAFYRWQGKMCDDREVPLVIKSSRRAFPHLRRLVEKLHSYPKSSAFRSWKVRPTAWLGLPTRLRPVPKHTLELGPGRQ